MLADEYKYVPVRRLALFLEETLYRNTQWVVFEPNDEPLWAQIRISIGAFMQDLFRQGAFQGTTPRDAYFVRCDAETTTQYDIDRGIVNIVVGFAPLKPAEFVVISIQQKTASRAGLRRTAMAEFTVNALRFDPYKNFKFRVKWDGRYVAGVSKVGALKRTTEVVDAPQRRRPEQQPQVAGAHRVRGDHRSSAASPTTSSSSSGRTRSGTSAPAWARRRRSKDFRKDIILEVYNEAGQLAIAYKVFRCWVSEYQALPELDANANAVAIQTLKLENEGWERDYDVAEPSEPSFVEPADPRRRCSPTRPQLLAAWEARLAGAAGRARRRAGARGPGSPRTSTRRWTCRSAGARRSPRACTPRRSARRSTGSSAAAPAARTST